MATEQLPVAQLKCRVRLYQIYELSVGLLGALVQRQLSTLALLISCLSVVLLTVAMQMLLYDRHVLVIIVFRTTFNA